MAAEQAIFEIVVNGEKAKRELDNTRKAAESLGGAYDGLELRLNKLSKAADGYAQKSMTMSDVAKQLQQRLGPQAAAISSIAANLGDHNNEMGKAVQMAGQLAAAYAAGGPLGVGIAGVTVLITQMQQAWDAELLAQDRAIEKRFEASGKLIEAHNALEKEVTDLNRQLHPETQLQAWDRNTNEIYKLQGQLLVAQSLDEQRELKGTIKLLEQRRQLENERFNQGAGGAPAAPKAGTGPIADGGIGDLHGRISSLLHVYDQEQKAKGQLLKEEFELFDIEKKQEADRVTAAQKAADELAKIDEDRAKAHRASLAEIRQQEEDHFKQIDGYFNEFYTGSVASAVSSGIGAIGTYYNALSEHHKHAAEEAQAAFLQSVGGQLVGIGQRALFEGAEVLLTSHGLDPAGYGLIALGGAAVAAGVGMGAAGAGISANVSALSAKEGKGDRQERGVNGGSRGSGGGGSSGGVNLTVVNNYGAGGPPAEDTARATVRAFNLASRRRFR